MMRVSLAVGKMLVPDVGLSTRRAVVLEGLDAGDAVDSVAPRLVKKDGGQHEQRKIAVACSPWALVQMRCWSGD